MSDLERFGWILTVASGLGIWAAVLVRVSTRAYASWRYRLSDEVTERVRLDLALAESHRREGRGSHVRRRSGGRSR